MAIPSLLNMRLRHGSVIAFTGLMGSGKTGCMSLMAARQALGGYRVAANYDTVFGDRIHHFEDLESQNTCFCLDEYQLTIGARDFTAQVNKDVSAWMELRIRKRDNILLYTTQDIDMVDVNARRLLYRIYDSELVQSRAGDYAKVAVYQNARYGQFTLVNTFYLEHKLFYGLYSTKDEDVILTSKEPKEPKNKKQYKTQTRNTSLDFSPSEREYNDTNTSPYTKTASNNSPTLSGIADRQHTAIMQTTISMV